MARVEAMPVFPVTEGAGGGKSQVQGQPQQLNETLSLIKTEKGLEVSEELAQHQQDLGFDH